MITNFNCVECGQDLSSELIDDLTLDINPNVYVSNQVHLTCLGKALAFGVCTPALLAGLRSALPQDLSNPEAITSHLCMLGRDLALYGAFSAPLGPTSPLRNWMEHSAVDTLTGSTQIKNEIQQLLTSHLDQHPDDKPIRDALLHRQLVSNVSAEEAIDPPENIRVSNVMIMSDAAHEKISSGDLVSLEAKAIRSAQNSLMHLC